MQDVGNRLIVVLGMHRSGTSAITRGLQVLGVGLGNRLIPPLEGNNVKGFSEDADLNAFNIAMLNAIESDWHHLAPVEPSDVEILRRKGYLLRAVEMLRQKVDRISPFGFKDPRVAKLLPFWKEAFSHSRLDVSFVLAVRHPLSVVMSLRQRDGLEAEKSYLLWLGHVLASLSGSVGASRVLVDYDRMMQSPEYELDRVAKSLNLKIDPIELERYRSEFLDQGLRHTVYELNDLYLDDSCPPIVREVYAALYDVAREKTTLEDFQLQTKTALWNAECERLRSPLLLADKLVMQRTIVSLALADRDKQIVERDAQIASLGQTIESLVVDRDSQKAGLRQLQSDFTALAQERDAQIASLGQTIESLVIDRDSQKVGLEALSQERDAQVMSLGQTIGSLAIDRDAQKAGLQQLQSDFQALTQERDAQLVRLGQTIESLVVDRDSQKAGLEALSQERDAQVLLVEKLKTELATVYKSNSWRLTSPLRWLIRQIYQNNKTVTHERYASLPATSYQDRQTSGNATNTATVTSESNDVKFRILLVSHYCPSRAHAGGLRILDIYTLIRERCPNVQIDIFTFHRPSIDWSLEDVRRIFHNVYLSPKEELKPDALLALRGSPLRYDVIDLQFHQTGHQIDAFRHIGSKIIFTPMESLAKVALTNLRSSHPTTSSPRLFKIAASLRSAAEEVIFALKADEVVCVSRADAALLRAVTTSRRVRGLDTGVSQLEFAEALAPGFVGTSAGNRRCNALYLAYFGSETNVLALRWYLDHVHATIRERVPDYVLTVVGRGDLSAFSSYQDKSIEFVGAVDAIAPLIHASRVGIAPALAGSGFRGKVNQYSILGVPSVVSPIAHKGLAYQDGINIFVAEKPEVFADRCIKLLTDLELNDRMGQAARKLCLASYSWQSKWPAISKIYNLAESGTQDDS